MKKPFRWTGKRKNPQTYVDVRVDSDRFDGKPDRYHITVWAGFIFKVLTYELEGFNGKDHSSS